MNQANAPLLN